VLAHVPPGRSEPLLSAMLGRRFYEGSLERIDADRADFSYRKLRKRERPFVLPLDPGRSRAGRARRL
jgi:hypothetical protein